MMAKLLFPDVYCIASPKKTLFKYTSNIVLEFPTQSYVTYFDLFKQLILVHPDPVTARTNIFYDLSAFKKNWYPAEKAIIEDQNNAKEPLKLVIYTYF
jgi:hypothetical protein